MYEDIEEITKIVANLNDHIDSDIVEEICFEIKTDGYCVLIKFLGCVIWLAENDEREYFEDKDKYEPLEEYLIKEKNKLIDKLIKLR